MAELVATPGPDLETRAVYDRAARDYAAGTARPRDIDHTADMAGFLAHIPDGGQILDLGCGPGHWAATFRDMGYAVEATDASPGMAALAHSTYGVAVEVAPFETLCAQDRFHGIWANFSLLHARRAALPSHLKRLKQALRPSGALHLGMKLGQGTSRDPLGRLFTYYSETELIALTRAAGFTITRNRRGNGQGDPTGPDTYVIVTAHG